MESCRSCDNCANRMHIGMFGREPCFGWECSSNEAEAIETAATCERWCPETDEEDEEEYIPSSSAGDYGPGNPWDAPGMSVSDFITGTIY